MPTEAFVQTFVIATLGLGSAIFVLVAVIPTILPNAIDGALARLKDIRAELPGLGALASGEVSKKLDELKEKMDDLKVKINSINMILRIGGTSSVLFILAGLLGLVLLAGYPSYDSLGLPYYADTTFVSSIEVLFVGGLVVGALFAAMFSNLVTLLLPAKPVGELLDLVSPTSTGTPKEGQTQETASSEVLKEVPQQLDFVVVAKESKLLMAQSPDLIVRRWFPANRQLRVTMSCTDTADCMLLFYESSKQIAPESVPRGQSAMVDSRSGVREWFKEVESPGGVWTFAVHRPPTNWLNGVATVEVWER